IPVISFVTRKLISGHKGEFVNEISKALGVKIITKASQGTRVTIKGADPSRVEAAIQILRSLDQQAKIIADTQALTTTSSVGITAYAMVKAHLLSLMDTAVKSLPPLSAAGVFLESEVPPEERGYMGKTVVVAPAAKRKNRSEPAAEPEQEAQQGDGKWKPKPRALTIKFNSSSFQPRNLSQALTYLASKDAEISYVYAAGPMGGGKTHTPLRAAFESYNESRVDEILVIRPGTSTGKDPGAMPGDPRRKQAPYLKGGIASNIEKMLVKLDMAALEKAKVLRAFTPDFERGETYDHAFILVDEPQNLSMEQAELLIGRLGEGSVMVFAGDIGGKQNDLKGQVSGLVHLIATQASATKQDGVLKDGTAFIQFQHEDSAARNKILPHVSRALNEPPSAYADFMRAILEARKDSKIAKAIEGTREFAVSELEKASENTLLRYGKDIRANFPDLYNRYKDVLPKQEPRLKVA
ncbi:MAG TPA: PhoH family protein, partial [Micavibrio sp.]|nr:PhoH family protein [Micavibrio sp.]